MNEEAKTLRSDADFTTQRGAFDSSTQSSRDDVDSRLTPVLKTYRFCCTLGQNLKVCDEQKDVIYFSESSVLGSAPDLVLHQGVDKHGPVVAVAHFRFTRDLKLGLGDPDTVDKEVIWENMENTSSGIGHHRYCLEMTINNKRRSFLWQRSRNAADGARGVRKIINWSYKVVDKSSGEVVAVYEEKFFSSWRNKGKLQLKADLGKEWELMILLGSLGICEKGSRRGVH